VYGYRCKLVAFIKQEFPKLSDEIFDYDAASETSPILEYLKTISPSAVDVDLRALCMHDDDVEGILYLRAMISMFARQLATGLDFEVLQAYLHRFLLIHCDVMRKHPDILDEISDLKFSTDSAGEKFREALQKNLCLLKVFAKLRTI
jgi:U3 small nucleolar RNA-associated protein 21